MGIFYMNKPSLVYSYWIINTHVQLPGMVVGVGLMVTALQLETS